MGAQTLNRQVWQIDRLVFDQCTSLPILEDERVYPILTQTHMEDLRNCEAAIAFQQQPLTLSPHLETIWQSSIQQADNLSDDLAYIRGKLSLYQLWGLSD